MLQAKSSYLDKYRHYRLFTVLYHIYWSFVLLLRYVHFSKAKKNHEIRIFIILGLKRNGNHAVINWLINQLQGKVFLFNNVDIRKKHLFQNRQIYRFITSKTSNKAYFVYSFEDRNINEVHNYLIRKKIHGEQLIILRDPYNAFASRIKKWESQLNNTSENKTMVNQWISYANASLDNKSNTSLICYNHWATQQEYRKNIASQLNIPFSDKGINDVTFFGEGSSFDKEKFKNHASKMQTDQRWKIFEKNNAFKKIFIAQPEVHELSKQIFGPIAGIDDWLNSN